MRPAPDADLSHWAIGIDLRAVSIAEGVRAALAVAVIIAAREIFQWSAGGEVALAALLTCMCDVGGLMRRRVPALLSFTVLGAAIVAGCGLARAGGLAVALPLGVFGLFCTSFARAWGQAAQQVGTLLAVVLVLSLDVPLPGVAVAMQLGGWFLAGGLWATLLTLVIWRVHPYRPMRLAVARCYDQIALLVADLRGLLGRTPAGAPEWEAHARAHRRSVRDAIETARIAVLDTLRARGAAGARAAQGLIRLEAADQIFAALIGMSDALENAPAAEQEVAGRALRRLRPLLVMLGRAIEEDRIKAAPIARSIAAMAQDAALLAEGSVLRGAFDHILDRLRIGLTLAAPATQMAGTGAGGAGIPLLRRIIEPLRANLDPRSLVLRHALRAAVVAAPAIAFTLIWFTPYDHWLTITIVATMQPYFGLTMTRALERIGGTMLGGAIALVIAFLCHSPLSIALAMFPLAVLAMAVRQVSYGLFIAALTPLIVLLVEAVEPGASEWAIAGMRALFTVLGGGVAIIGCLVLWPSWEPERLPAELRQAIRAHGAYADAVLASLSGEGVAGQVEAARREAGVASNNVEASISRALLEPRQSVGGAAGRDGLEAALVIDAALRRLAARLVAIQLDPVVARSLPAAGWLAWRGWIVAAMAALAEGRMPGERPEIDPTLTAAAEPLLRIARQVSLVGGVIGRVAA
ncbi:MAG: FUSC family protein [Rhodospirillales bacterium]|nr:FUSC family protein [Rhodospirillales bacterium]